MSEADSSGLLASLLASAQVRTGLVLDAGEADAGWLELPAPAALRVALSGEPAAIARWQRLTVTQLALPAAELSTAPATAVFVPCTPGRDLAAEVSAAADAAAGRPVLAEVTVSVGRTVAEARARADADELFALTGHPAQQGLFGTLEECQAAAAQLAQAGATRTALLPAARRRPSRRPGATAVHRHRGRRAAARGTPLGRAAAARRMGRPAGQGLTVTAPDATQPNAANVQNSAAFVQDSELKDRPHSGLVLTETLCE